MKKQFYITTPLYYPSGDLHIGHVYSTILADTICRYKKLKGFDTFFLTGSDEHGQKIAEKAKKSNMSEMDFLNEKVTSFKSLWSVLSIGYDKFLRTTDESHKKAIQNIFSVLLAKNEIYKGQYSGKYCVPCESTWQLSQIEKIDGEYVCSDCQRTLTNIEEESYFLKLKGKEDFLTKLLKEEFLFPERNVSELMSKFISPGLIDLSVSRSTFKWGIPIVENEGHVVYVWMDALPNYITALGYGSDDDSNFKKYWNNETEILHVVGKEIVRFHAIYWPVILEDLGILPKNLKVMGHGWITSEGKKMSKSLGNIINPYEIIKEYSVEHLRYYLLKEIATQSDGDFSKERFINLYNSDLANKYGNLVSRTMGMIDKYFDKIIPEYKGCISEFDKDLERDCSNTIELFVESMDTFDISTAIKKVIKLIENANLYIDNTKPWVIVKDEEKIVELESLMVHLVKVIEVASFLLKPILIESAELALKQINILDTNFVNILDYKKNNNKKLEEKMNLFPRIEK